MPCTLVSSSPMTSPSDLTCRPFLCLVIFRLRIPDAIPYVPFLQIYVLPAPPPLPFACSSFLVRVRWLLEDSPRHCKFIHCRSSSWQVQQNFFQVDIFLQSQQALSFGTYDVPDIASYSANLYPFTSYSFPLIFLLYWLADFPRPILSIFCLLIRAGSDDATDDDDLVQPSL